MGTKDLAQKGRDAFAVRAWAAAYEALVAADASVPLGGDDLDRLAATAHLTGRYEETTGLWARAHEAHLAGGQIAKAVRSAFWLGFGLSNAGDFTQAMGWFARAGRLLDENEMECVERGYLILPLAIGTFESGDPASALSLFEQADRCAREYDDVALQAFTRLGRARCLIRMERAQEGIPLLDELLVSMTSEQIPVVAAGDLYCTVILACRDLFDVRRSSEWTRALRRWCDAQPDIVPYRGQCSVHLSELKQLRGDWSGALEEVQLARTLLSDPPGQPAIGMAYYQEAELHRIQGDFAEAELLYRSASEFGHDPNPGLALLRLAQGKLENAQGAIQRATDEAADRVSRARMLPAFVEIMLGAERIDDARAAAAELADIAHTLGASLLLGSSAHATSAVRLAEDDARGALEAARRAWAVWQELEAPYEGARTRVIAGIACGLLGDEDGAELELSAARGVFEQLGAAHDVARIDSLVGPTEPTSGGLTGRELEVLRLVAAGKTNKAIARDLVLSEKTVARHLSNIFTKLGLSSRAAATAYAYEHHLV